LQWLRARLSPF